MIASGTESKSPRASRLYWTVQIVSWSTYAVTNVLLFSQGRVPSVSVWGENFAGSAMGLLFTHLIRRAIRRGQWLTRPVRFWLPRCLGAVLLCAPLLTLTYYGVVALHHPVSASSAALSFALVITFNFVCLFGLWLAIYVGVQFTIRWRKAEIERLNALASAQRAELQWLRSKLEPHFLFNALNTITSLVDEDPELARGAIRRLSNVLRTTLTVDALALAPFGNEWAFTHDYLQLEELRFPSRLRVHASLHEEIMTCLVPTFSLQTLVENAIKHGINRHPGNGFVEITAALKAGTLSIQVRNKGRLAPPSPNSTQVGLSTLRERLNRLCGAGSSVALTEDAEGCVTATLVVPQKT